MEIVTQFPCKVEERPDVGIRLSDGTRLSARVWAPADAVERPVPAILEYLPYRKRDGTVARDALTHPWFAGRGNGDSEGVMEDEYAPQEQADALEVIDWIAAQPWCTGAVGMMGISWGGFNALQVAALAPPALKAIVTLCSTVDRYADDIHYKGGCLLNENLGWGATMLAYSSRPPDPALVGERWREMWMERLEAEPFLAADWLERQTRAAYWRHGSVCEEYGAIRAKVLAFGGWADGYKNAVAALVENLPGSKGVVGPWIHKYPHFATPEPRIGFLQEALRWWDRWLKGEPTGVEDDPALRLYLMDGVPPRTSYARRPGRWIAMDGPRDGIETRRLHLREAGLSEGAGALARTLSSPQDCGLESGEYCAIWTGPDMPGDQRRDDALSACFDGEPLAAPLDIVGAPELRLRLAPDRPQGLLAARLCEVAPDGASTRVTYGVLNLTHRNGHERPEPLIPGEETEVAIRLDWIAWRAREGSRLRLALSTACWPLLWPSPAPLTVRLLGGSLDLPVRAELAEEDEWRFEPPEGAEPWDAETLRPASNSRRVIRNAATGEVTVEIEDDFGEHRDRGHGLAAGGVGRERWTIDPADPLSARGETRWTQTLSRGAWSVRTETESAMTAAAASFQLTARIEAYEGEALVFTRDFQRSIPRDGV